MTNRLGCVILLRAKRPPRSASGANRQYAVPIYNVPVIFVRFGEHQMKKTLASLIAASVALISVSAIAQEASAPAAAAPAASAPAKAKKHHKELKHHGKRAKVEEAASAAGTSDKGTQN
ncbi:hypothetical protein PSP6_680054 [Paraburkholderia tropica]|jgi:hypothetical protein|nr:hypothetical protein PSP6_680054 [Paraburkholderia tropica]